MTDMTVAEAAEILRNHNEWRRGNYNDDPNCRPIQQPPGDIGKAIDVAIEFMTSEDGWASDKNGNIHFTLLDMFQRNTTRRFKFIDLVEKK